MMSTEKVESSSYSSTATMGGLNNGSNSLASSTTTFQQESGNNSSTILTNDCEDDSTTALDGLNGVQSAKSGAAAVGKVKDSTTAPATPSKLLPSWATMLSSWSSSNNNNTATASPGAGIGTPKNKKSSFNSSTPSKKEGATSGLNETNNANPAAGVVAVESKDNVHHPPFAVAEGYSSDDLHELNNKATNEKMVNAAAKVVSIPTTTAAASLSAVNGVAPSSNEGGRSRIPSAPFVTTPLTSPTPVPSNLPSMTGLYSRGNTATTAASSLLDKSTKSLFFSPTSAGGNGASANAGVSSMGERSVSLDTLSAPNSNGIKSDSAIKIKPSSATAGMDGEVPQIEDEEEDLLDQDLPMFEDEEEQDGSPVSSVAVSVLPSPPTRENTAINLDVPTRVDLLSTPVKSHPGAQSQNQDTLLLDMTNNAQPSQQQHHHSNNNNTSLHQFDPLIPKDWMMSFDSPAAANKESHGTSNGLLLQSSSSSLLDGTIPSIVSNGGASSDSLPTSSSILKTPKAPSATAITNSLMDRTVPLTSPRSTPLYTQRDLDLQASTLKASFDLEFTLAQQEINTLTERCTTLETGKLSMLKTLQEWEVGVRSMLKERDAEKTSTTSRIKELEEKVEMLGRERDLARREADGQAISYKQKCLDYDDLLKSTQDQEKSVAALKKQVADGGVRFESLRAHAESKLQEANVEIARVRATFEKDLLTTKSKLSRLEASNNTLQRSYEGKVGECEELVKICDALEKQLAL